MKKADLYDQLAHMVITKQLDLEDMIRIQHGINRVYYGKLKNMLFGEMIEFLGKEVKEVVLIQRANYPLYVFEV